ncbi:MAG: SprB repeat-containing protein [Lewinellaceae bacterium]|nr:SprB repeat-containing protein [Lewinellaceae bacterium]
MVADVSCFGVCDGTAELVSNYATTPATTGNFIYIWSDGLIPPICGPILCAGTHTVTSADNNGCGDTDTITILSPPQVTATTTASPASCFGLTDGSATVVASGGNGSPYTYLWSDANSSTTPTVVNLGAGQYVVTVTDVNGCTGILSSIFIAEPGEILGQSRSHADDHSQMFWRFERRYCCVHQWR